MSHEDEEEQLELQTIKSLNLDQIQQMMWPRCIICRRYTFGHDQGRGQNCRMIILSKEQLDKHDEEIPNLGMVPILAS